MFSLSLSHLLIVLSFASFTTSSLPVCQPLVFGTTFNEITTDCSFTRPPCTGGWGTQLTDCAVSTTGQNQILKVQGKAGTSHPKLVRGGKQPCCDQNNMYASDRHFTVSALGFLLLSNLELTGAWVGAYVGNGHYCETGMKCGPEQYGGAVRVESNGIAVLVDLIFSNNLGYGGGDGGSLATNTGANDIYAFTSSQMYFIDMVTPSSYSPFLKKPSPVHFDQPWAPGIGPLLKCDSQSIQTCLTIKTPPSNCLTSTITTQLGLTCSGTNQICTTCAGGKYCKINGKDGTVTCVGCIAGKYGTESGTSNPTTCLKCGAGLYQDETTGLASCKKCVAGRYSPIIGSDVESSCSPCSQGKYSSEIGSKNVNSCKVCLPGSYTPESTGSASCSLCNAGKYNSESGSVDVTHCEDCSKGKYSTAIGATRKTQCLSCSLGKYQDQLGQSTEAECKNCPQGYYSSEITGAILCQGKSEIQLG